MILFAVLSQILVNVVSLDAIATMGKVGFVIVFAAVNLAAFRLVDQTRGGRLLPARSSWFHAPARSSCWSTKLSRQQGLAGRGSS
jgi:amino acid transporter